MRKRSWSLRTRLASISAGATFVLASAAAIVSISVVERRQAQALEERVGDAVAHVARELEAHTPVEDVSPPGTSRYSPFPIVQLRTARGQVLRTIVAGSAKNFEDMLTQLPADGAHRNLMRARYRPMIEDFEGLTLDPPPPGWVVAERRLSPPVGAVASALAAAPSTEKPSTIGFRRAAATSVPLASLLVGALVWLVATRVMSPVSELRRQIDGTTLGDLKRRVAIPPDGDLRQLAQSFNEMLERLDASSRSQRQFVAGAAHELRTPLATLVANLDVALDHPALASAAVSDARREARRLTDLTESLLALASVEAEGFLATEVDFDDAIDHACAPFADDKVRVDTTGVIPCKVEGNVPLLHSLVRNLVENATHHACQQVRLATTCLDDVVELVVDDDGPGVTVEQRSDVFGPFWRSDDHRGRKSGGTGIGLALVAAIAKAHCGLVEISDSPLGGARFTVRLPVTGRSSRADPPTPDPSWR
jgi:signal transduction histidine kinase